MRILPKRKTEGSPRWGLWRWFDTPGYTRLSIVRCPLFEVTLNWITGIRDGGTLHDHPRAQVGVLLDGSYTEVIATPDGEHLVNGYFNHVTNLVMKTDPTQAHAIIAVDRAVTLMFAGRRRKPWSFFVPLGLKSPGEADCTAIRSIK